MPRFRLLAAVGMFALGLPCLPAFAESDVLVPSDSDYPSPPPQSKYDTDTPSLPALDPNSVNSAPMTTGYTPVPGMEPGSLAIPAPLSNPTHVMKIPVPAAESTAADASLPNSLKIDVGDKYVLGTADLTAIHNALGLAPGDVSQHCHLSIGGMIQSDANGYSAFDTGLQSHAIAHYSGKSGAITMHVQALCDMLPLPPNAGYVMQAGDKYSVFLYQTSCPAPPADAQKLVFQYNGDGKIQCAYQKD